MERTKTGLLDGEMGIFSRCEKQGQGPKGINPFIIEALQ